MSKEALKVWKNFPAEIRRKILSNVWCPQCKTVVTIGDYSADFAGGSLVLRGCCETCGHKVARVLEECGDNSKKTPKVALECYVFDVWIAGRGGAGDYEEKVLRRIQIPATKSLYNFAEVITRSFNFYFDHCFGFYDNFQRYHDSKKMYELFVDIGEDPVPGSKSVENTRINQVFKKVGERMLFLFDYGDCWYFAVELKKIQPAGKRDLKPKVLESIGKAPLQYPPCEEE